MKCRVNNSNSSYSTFYVSGIVQNSLTVLILFPPRYSSVPILQMMELTQKEMKYSPKVTLRKLEKLELVHRHLDSGVYNLNY